ncbi:hypothetical protein [Thiolapillus sp.]|uniref:hypothetical protein n=1 Tax=Thiolapillus sp. TaxID=2017437 RepID=UPI003AF567D4
MTRTAGAPIGCQRPSRFWGLGCPKIFHEAEDTLVFLYDSEYIVVMLFISKLCTSISCCIF